MKEVSLNPSEIIRAIKIARNTFGTFDFTYVPEAILEGESDEDSCSGFWNDSVYCVCFFPKTAHENATNRHNANDDQDFQRRTNGLEQVLGIFKCSADDEVVAIRVTL
jgi:hypothetical protein